MQHSVCTFELPAGTSAAFGVEIIDLGSPSVSVGVVEARVTDFGTNCASVAWLYNSYRGDYFEHSVNESMSLGEGGWKKGDVIGVDVDGDGTVKFFKYDKGYGFSWANWKD